MVGPFFKVVMFFLLLAFSLLYLPRSIQASTSTVTLDPSFTVHPAYTLSQKSTSPISSAGSANKALLENQYPIITTLDEDVGGYITISNHTADYYTNLAFKFTFNLTAYNTGGLRVLNISFKWDGYRSPSGGGYGTLIAQKIQHTDIDYLWTDDATSIPTSDGLGWEFQKTIPWGVTGNSFSFGLIFVVQYNTYDITLSTDAAQVVLTYDNPSIVAQNGVFRINSSLINYSVRLSYKYTTTYLNSKAVTWKIYSNGTQYDTQTATTNGTGWLNFRATKNLPFRNGTWSLWVSDGENETAVDTITASYYIQITNFNISYWPASAQINKAFNFNISFSNDATINSTAIKLSHLFVTVEAWWLGSIFIDDWTYPFFQADTGNNTHSESFINNLPVGNNTIRIRLYYYDNSTNNLLASQNRTCTVTGFGGGGEGGSGGGGGYQPEPSLPQQIMETVATNPLAQSGIVLIVVTMVGVSAVSQVRKSRAAKTSSERLRKKWRELMEG